MCLLLDLHLLLYLAKELFLGFQAWDVDIKTHCFTKNHLKVIYLFPSAMRFFKFFEDIISDGKFYIHQLFWDIKALENNATISHSG